jgi:hypothetical protein
VSSTYRGICLNHTPVLEFPVDSVYQSLPEFVAMLQHGKDLAIRDRTDTLEIVAHAGCDVVVGEYSYPLVDIYCLPNLDHRHAQPERFSPTDLKYLWFKLNSPHRSDRREARRTMALLPTPCWGPDRLNMLGTLWEDEENPCR